MQIHTNNANKIIYPELSYTLTGLLFIIHGKLDRFCKEKQYGDALEILLKKSSILYEREKVIPIDIDGIIIKSNRADFIIDNKILVELKSIPYITKTEYFQTQRYLKASKLKLGMIVNFRSKYLKPKRIINNEI